MSETLCRVMVYRVRGADKKRGWLVEACPRSDGIGEKFKWVGGMMEHYLQGKEHPRTMHEVHMLLYGIMGAVPNEVEVVFNDYGMPAMNRGEIAHLPHVINYGGTLWEEKDDYAV